MKPVLKVVVAAGPKKASAASRYKVPNLERGLMIMEYLMDFPQGLQQSEIAAQLRYSKTSVYRVTMTLLEYGYLVRDEETKALRLSRKLIAMGNRALGDDDLVVTSLDILKQLRDQVKETVLLGIIVDHELVVLSQLLGTHPFKFSVDLGCRLPIHTAAPGKAILAYLPEPERRAILGKMSFIRFNERTLASVEVFERELESVLKTGFALDQQEQLTGIHCVAAPIFNRHGYPIAAVWTTGPTDRIRAEDFPRVGALIKAHTAMISERLGFGLLPNNGNGNEHKPA
ncbi:MAG: IclR family transcriptional regulator [Verrucomicrobiota bacterium]